MSVELDPSSKSATLGGLGKLFQLPKPQLSYLYNGGTPKDVVRTEGGNALKGPFIQRSILWPHAAKF